MAFWRPPSRSIPACAGNTIIASLQYGPETVHPRVCGEHDLANSAITMLPGPSPRVRGTRSAGTPPVSADGPSPRVRGTRWDCPPPGIAIWSIPACAGNTALTLIPNWPKTVHPRVCGEHMLAPNFCGPAVRSIPACAGNTHPRAWRGQWRRSIPACAGNTSTTVAMFITVTVHPRVCGEHPTVSARHVDGTGPSPRVRGTREAIEGEVGQVRSIPACAGNTPGKEGRFFVVPGPSPRVRGTLLFYIFCGF